MTGTFPESTRVRFWARVDRTGEGCWPWTGRLNREGRGRFTADGTTRYSYVWSLLFKGVVVVAGQPVRHSCGNPACVRPDHLDPNGGQGENNRDTLDHGRNRSARLDAQKARRIRERWAAPDRPSQQELALQYGVTPSAISEVVTGKSWTRAGGPVRPSRRSQTPKLPRSDDSR